MKQGPLGIEYSLSIATSKLLGALDRTKSPVGSWGQKPRCRKWRRCDVKICYLSLPVRGTRLSNGCRGIWKDGDIETRKVFFF